MKSKIISIFVILLLFNIGFISLTSNYAKSSSIAIDNKLITYNSYIDFDIDISPLNEPLRIDETTTIPINVTYTTDIPSNFIRFLPFRLKYRFLYEQTINPMQNIILEILDEPSWANIYILPSVTPVNIPFDNETSNTTVNLVISPTIDAPAQPYTITLRVSCESIGRVNGSSYRESFSFTPAFIPCMEINSAQYVNLTQNKSEILPIEIKNCGNKISRITSSIINNTYDNLFNITPSIVEISPQETYTFSLNITPSVDIEGNIPVNLSFKLEAYPYVEDYDYLIEYHNIDVEIYPVEEEGFELSLSSIIIIVLILIIVFLLFDKKYKII
jgi:hypothetical protein